MYRMIKNCGLYYRGGLITQVVFETGFTVPLLRPCGGPRLFDRGGTVHISGCGKCSHCAVSVVNYGALILKALFDYWPQSSTFKERQKLLKKEKVKEDGECIKRYYMHHSVFSRF